LFSSGGTTVVATSGFAGEAFVAEGVAVDADMDSTAAVASTTYLGGESLESD
jgi:hypothetical protein